MLQPQTARARFKGIKIHKLNRLSMELAGYNSELIHIKGKHYI